MREKHQQSMCDVLTCTTFSAITMHLCNFAQCILRIGIVWNYVQVQKGTHGVKLECSHWDLRCIWLGLGQVLMASFKRVFKDAYNT